MPKFEIPAQTEAPKRGPGRPRKHPIASEPALMLVDGVMYEADMRASLSCSKSTMLDRIRNDPDFPPLFNMGRQKACLISDWNAYLQKLRVRGYVPRVALRDGMRGRPAKVGEGIDHDPQ